MRRTDPRRILGPRTRRLPRLPEMEVEDHFALRVTRPEGLGLLRPRSVVDVGSIRGRFSIDSVGSSSAADLVAARGQVMFSVCFRPSGKGLRKA